MKLVKIFAVLFIAALVVLMLFQRVYTTGEYEARIFYEKASEGYILKGLEVRIKSAKISGEYTVELLHTKSRYSGKIPVPLSPEKEGKLFGIISYDPKFVEISRHRSANSILYYLHVRPNAVLFVKENEEIVKFIDCNDALILEEPIKFNVILTPAKGGWVVNVENVKVVVEKS